MKKTLAVAGTVVALVVVPGSASAAEAATVPASLVVQQSNCATDNDGGSNPVDEDGDEESGESDDGSGTGTPGTEDNDPEEDGSGGQSDPPSGDPTTEPSGDPTTEPSAEPTTEPSAEPTTEPTTGFSAGRSSFGLPRQQAADDCSEALELGSNYSDEDGDGEPEVKDQADDDRDGQVDEVDTTSQVSVVPDGGAETGDGSTGGVVGMTAAGAAVLALFAGLGLWARRALARV